MQQAGAAAASRPDAAVEVGKRERTKTRNRAMILSAAREVFATLGFEVATVRDIVRKTDLAVGTFYQYFRDKNEVFAAVAEDALTELRGRLRRYRTDPDRPFADRIFTTYLAFFEFVVQERHLYEVLDRNFGPIVGDLSAETTRLSLEDIRQDLLPALEGQQAADLPIDYVAAASFGIGMLVARQLLDRPRPDPHDAARVCTRLLLSGLGGDNAAAPVRASALRTPS